MLSGEITLNKWLKNKIVLEFSASPQKMKHLPYMEIIVPSTKKGKQVCIDLFFIKAAFCFSEKPFFKHCSQQQQLASSSYQRTQQLGKLLIKTCFQSNFTAQLCRNWITSPFARSDVQLEWNSCLSLRSQKACNSFSFKSRSWSYTKSSSEVQKDCFFEIDVNFIYEENIVTYVDFDSSVTLYTETPREIKQFNRERNYHSGSCEKHECIPSNDQYNCFLCEAWL